MSKKTVALIPLRGGSKGIPDKNIKLLGGKPLCAWVLEAACHARNIDTVYVSTESSKIRNVVEGLGLDITVIDRPIDLASDTTSTEAVMLHFADQVAFDILFTIQATSPLLASAELDDAFTLFISEKYDSMVSAVRTKRFYWDKSGTPLNYDPACRPRRQDFDGIFIENGAFYITTVDLLNTNKCRLGGRIGVYEMSPEAMAEIDEPEDWPEVESLVLNRTIGDLSDRIKKIHTVICDVDGTLTDGGMYYGAGGEMLKKFNTKDAKGLSLLREAGINIVILTAEQSEAVKARCAKLGIEEYFPGISNKSSFLDGYCTEKEISPDEVAYIGDDLNDLACLQKVGLAACPADAEPEIRKVSHIIAASDGGCGAVRDICNRILNIRTRY